MFIALEIIGILFMVTFILIGIWSFIILNRVYDQLKYKNYLIEKINHNLSLKNKCNDSKHVDKKTEDLYKKDLDNSDKISLEKASSGDDVIKAYDSESLSPDKKQA